jgi:hypothetical protein
MLGNEPLFMVAVRRPRGSPIGTVEWVGMLTAGSVSLVILLTYRPRLAAGLGLALPVCAAAASLMMH